MIGEGGEYLFLGVNEYMELFNDLNYKYFNILNFDYKYINNRNEVMGMKIFVIPYMNGIMILPKNFMNIF